MTSSRNVILERIEEALRLPAPPPHDHTESPGKTGTAQDWLPAVAETTEDRIAQFAERSVELKTEFHSLTSLREAGDVLRALRDAEGWTRLALHRHSLLEPLAAELGIELFHTDAGYDPLALERCEAGLTACDALIAQTGSVLLTTASAGGRALSVLPPHHIVLARRDDLLPDLPSAFALLQQRYVSQMPSFTTFITGPSRTGDIERILVLGAHGPKRLTVLLV